MNGGSFVTKGVSRPLAGDVLSFSCNPPSNSPWLCKEMVNTQSLHLAPAHWFKVACHQTGCHIIPSLHTHAQWGTIHTIYLLTHDRAATNGDVALFHTCSA